MAKRKNSQKLKLDIRVDGKGDYIVSVIRPLPKKPLFIPETEIYVVSTIEDVEQYVSSLLRSGRAPK